MPFRLHSALEARTFVYLHERKMTVATDPDAERANMILLGTTLDAERGYSKVLKAAGHAPQRGGHLSLQHCAARVLAFGSPQRNTAGAFIDQCQTLTFQIVQPGGAKDPRGVEPIAGLLAALTGVGPRENGPLFPNISLLMPTVEAILDKLAQVPELADQLASTAAYLEFMDLPRPFGLTALLRMTSGGSEVMWTYRQPQVDCKPANPKDFPVGAVIKTTKITTAVLKAYAELWADSMKRPQIRIAAA